MASLADVVAAFKTAFGAGLGTLFIHKYEITDDLGPILEAAQSAVQRYIADRPGIEPRDILEHWQRSLVFTRDALLNPGEFIQEMFSIWDGWVADVLGELNVEVGAIQGPGEIAAYAQVAEKMEAGRNGAQRRVTTAITLINVIIVTANAASAVAEMMSAGRVRTIAEAIQGWIWANGLGSFSPLAFQPQVNASIQPYLQRYYNAQAQAQIPPVTDIIRFQLREVYLAERRPALVGDEERPVFDALMEQWGFDKFHADSYWGAHWQLLSIGQLNESLFRGVIDLDEWRRQVRFNDVVPEGIPWLEEIIFNTYTRVDTRRMDCLGILSEQELLQSYRDGGYFAPTAPDANGNQRAVSVQTPDFSIHKAQGLVVFTKLFNALPELRQRFAKGHISPSELRIEIAATGIDPSRVELVWQTLVKNTQAERTAPERELTRALIASAWKKRIVSFSQAVFLLERIGWDAAEAELILRVRSEVDQLSDFEATMLGTRLAGQIVGIQPTFEDDEEF